MIQFMLELIPFENFPPRFILNRKKEEISRDYQVSNLVKVFETHGSDSVFLASQKNKSN